MKVTRLSAQGLLVSLRVALAMALVLGFARGGAATSQEEAVSELDAFMQEVLSKRLRNWEDLYRFTVRDRVSFEVRGPGAAPIEGFNGEYIWYVRDGYMVRSPVKANGVAVGPAERERYERRFLERLQREDERRAAREQAAEESGEPLERENFLGFPFEPGNYLLAGRETFEGMEVLRIEYYPVKLFEDDGDAADDDAPAGADTDDADRDDVDPQEAAITRGFQKTSRVTMLVLPEERQIVKITFDNVGLEFLPLRWLVQVEDVSASLTMTRIPGEEVWLPRDIVAHGGVAVATGTYEATFRLEYFDYKRTEVQAKVRFQLPDQQDQR